MLTELSIKNFAIIDDISIQFDQGLTVLTGETGAGKSIIIDAVQLLAGNRASVDFIRHGENRAEIVGLFDIEKNLLEIQQLCKEHDIEFDQEEHFLLERIITNKGKSVCRINGKIVTLSILKQFGMMLLNIHSQHDHVHLMDKQTHIELLDAYGAKELNILKEEYVEKYETYIFYKKEYDSINEDEQKLAHRLDLLKFQAQEIQDAQLLENEDVLLEKERNELQNYASIHQAVTTAYDALYGENKALEWIDVSVKALQEEAIQNTPLLNKKEELLNLFYTLEEITYEIRDYEESLFYDENRLNEIEERLNLIQYLKRKYGNSVNDILDYYENISSEINKIENRELHNEQLIKNLLQSKENVIKIGEKLHNKRKAVAKKLSIDIQKELKDLYLEHTTFEIELVKNKDNIQINGIDQVQFLLATNKGEPLKALHKVASGGEISRIMLALKKIFAKHDQIGTVIFDEIDTGVSGRVAQAIAEKMYEISRTTQVLCITHLAQVAAMSDAHVLIEKQVKENRTLTSITFLKEEEKIKELGKMITGLELTETAIKHAHQLLDLSLQYKNSRD